MIVTMRKSGQYPSIDIGRAPWQVVASKDGQCVYTRNLDGTVSYVDLASKKVIHTFHFDGAYPAQLAITPDSSRLYVTTREGETLDAITVINITRRWEERRHIRDQVHKPGAITITPDGKRAYFINNEQQEVSWLDLHSNKVSGTVKFTTGFTRQFSGIATSPDGKHVYVTDNGSIGKTPPRLSLIDTDTNTAHDVTAGLNEPDANFQRTHIAHNVVASGDGKYAHVLFTDDTLWGHSTTSPSFTVNEPNMCPDGMAASSISSAVYLTSGAAHKITAITPDGHGSATTHITHLPDNIHPSGIAVSPDGRKFYVGDLSYSLLYEIKVTP